MTTSSNHEIIAMQNQQTTLKLVQDKGNYLNTQDIANAIGRNWQHVNKLRSAGRFIDPSAKLGNAFLYSRARADRWIASYNARVERKAKSSAA